MSEAQLRHKVLALLRPLHAVSIESPREAGVPDINFSHGWIELKHNDEWPARHSTVIQPSHFTSAQRDWLETRCRTGGNAWLLFRIAQEWFLVWGSIAAMFVGKVWTSQEFMKIPTMTMTAQLPYAIQFREEPTGTELMNALLARKWY